MNQVVKAWTFFSLGLCLFALSVLLFSVPEVSARNINEYKNTITNSAPNTASNHTLSFLLNTALSPGAYIEITPPPGFEILGTSTFAAERNVELSVGNIIRAVDTTANAVFDGVSITTGTPGQIRYTLNSTDGIASGSRLELKIGNHTLNSLQAIESYSTTTGTTTSAADIKPIINGPGLGTHKFAVRAYDGGLVADADFSIAILERVGVGPVDTTEEVPPVRFNGAPSSTVTGVTLNVEVFVETDELASCRYALSPGIDYFAMTLPFPNTGLIYHTVVVPVAPSSTYQYFVRCIDDEGNFNIDDYIVEFTVSPPPTGSSGGDGTGEGPGTGGGGGGTGTGGGGGSGAGTSGGSGGSGGGSSGGGSGGGGGGGTGPNSGSTAGGGFESTDGPYRSGDGRVTIAGFSAPRSTVVALVDGREAERVTADTSGAYAITIDAIARGVYTFSVFAIDSASVRSSNFATSFTVAGARTSALTNINLVPTLLVAPNPVTPLQPVTISGYTLANATVTIENEREGSAPSRQQITVESNSAGFFTTTIATTGFTNGTYKVRARSKQAGGVETSFSNYTIYGVGQAAAAPRNADLNRDGRVNLVDFSILLFWWNTAGGDSDPAADINGDARVNLVDFSILLFNWTG